MVSPCTAKLHLAKKKHFTKWVSRGCLHCARCASASWLTGHRSTLLTPQGQATRALLVLRNEQQQPPAAAQPGCTIVERWLLAPIARGTGAVHACAPGASGSAAGSATAPPAVAVVAAAEAAAGKVRCRGQRRRDGDVGRPSLYLYPQSFPSVPVAFVRCPPRSLLF